MHAGKKKETEFRKNRRFPLLPMTGGLQHDEWSLREVNTFYK